MAQKKVTRRTRRTKNPVALPEIQPMVAGIDLGSREHWVCGPQRADGEVNVKVFPTVTSGLEAMGQWLLEQGVISVAMESTYVYWIPAYEMLESLGLEVVLVNARQLHWVPARKTDLTDCQWIQLLHSRGLLRGSFRPHEKICRLRTLRRQMNNLVAERTRAVQWMQKSLDQMNIQVHRAVSDITGKTGMAIISSIVAGERDPQKLAALRDRRCRKDEREIAEHLTGTWRTEHLFNLGMALRHYDHLVAAIAAYESQLDDEIIHLQQSERLKLKAPPHPNSTKQRALRKRGEESLRQNLWRLCGVDLTRIDGISAPTARLVITEVGLDLSAFPTEDHFVSWLRLAPNTAYSGGKRVKPRRNSLGANHVAGSLRMAALSLKRSPSALGAHFRRISRRKSGSIAIFATARKLAVYIYRMLRYGQDYVDIGEAAYEARYREQRLRGLAEAAKQLGFELAPMATE